MNAMTRTLMGAALSGAYACAWANPTGPAIVSGSALVSNPSASVMQVVNTPGTILNWQGFSIANGETTRFVQLNAASAVLNRVLGTSASDILGRLDSNGRVFLVNANGIVFGGSAVVDVAGLIASTRNITDANFLAGTYTFEAAGAGSGAITLRDGAQILTSTYGPGGQVWLFAKNVMQEAGATITAPQGQVVLAAGSKLQVAQSALGNMTFTVDVNGGETIELLGSIAAERGAVGLFADNIKVRDNAVVNVSAAASGDGGSISAQARTLLEVERLADVAADGGSSDGDGGKIALAAADVRVSPVANAFGNVHASARSTDAEDGSVTVSQTEATSLTQAQDVKLGEFRSGETSSPFFGVEAPGVAVLADGSYVIVWKAEVWGTFNGTNQYSTDIRALKVDANGSPVGESFIVAEHAWTQNADRPSLTDTTDQRNPSVTALKGGGYVVVWTSHSVVFVGDGVPGSSAGTYSQPKGVNMKVFGPSNPTGPVNLASITTGDCCDPPLNPAVAALANGEFVASWSARDPSDNKLKMQVQRFDAGGSSVGSAENTGIVVKPGGIIPKMAGLGGGGYVSFRGFLAFDSTVTNTETNLHRFDGGGRLVESSVVPEPGFGVSGLVGGGYALGQNLFLAPSGFVQRFSADGTKLGSEIAFDAAGLGATVTSVAGTADGGALAVGGSIDSIAATNDGGHAVAYRKFVNAGNPYDGSSLQLKILEKQAATSSSSSIAGEAGKVADFTTAPGVAPDTSVAPPSAPPAPPPVVTGNPNGGASFGGVSGCNFQGTICSETQIRALALVDAELAAAKAANRSGSGIGTIEQVQEQVQQATGVTVGEEEAYTAAVLALARAAGQADLFTPDQARGAAVLVMDDGMARRLFQTGNFANMTSQERLETLRTFIANNLLSQQTDTGGDATEHTNYVTLLANMSEAEQRAHMESIAKMQAEGRDADLQ